MASTINGTLIAHNLQLTPNVLALFRGGFLSVTDQQPLEEIDLLAASMLFDLSEAVLITGQGDLSPIQLPTDERSADDVEALGPFEVADETSADGGTLLPLACFHCDGRPGINTPSSYAFPETLEVAPFASSGAHPYGMAFTSTDDCSEETIGVSELDEAWFDFEKYQESTCTKSSKKSSDGPADYSQGEADIDGDSGPMNEAAVGKEDVKPNEDEDDDVVIVDIRPAKRALRVDQDEEAAQKRRRVSRSSVVPYALVSQRARRGSERAVANLNRWTAFTRLWREICSAAMRIPGLSRSAEAMDGYVTLVDDDDWDFQLWMDPLKKQWDDLSDKMELCGAKVIGKFGRAEMLLKEISSTY